MMLLNVWNQISPSARGAARRAKISQQLKENKDLIFKLRRVLLDCETPVQRQIATRYMLALMQRIGATWGSVAFSDISFYCIHPLKDELPWPEWRNIYSSFTSGEYKF